MISIQVSYTVKPSFVAQNKANVNQFLADFKKLAGVNFLYNVYIKEDGLTFLHVSMYEDETVQAQVLNTPSFVAFQEQRDLLGLASEPIIEELNLLGSSLSLLTKN
eukprot:GDKJ01027396.1.p2 GENE.GDKJ01027396.1~~GDKJ01027396.1.p2  ORF type:complete len:106 (+),score=8.85 GDKJ01027396.1:487-804(+)